MPTLFYNLLTAPEYDGLEGDEYDGLVSTPELPPSVVQVLDPPSTILATYLTEGSGAYFTEPDENEAWPLYISALPDGDGIPDSAACLYDTTGMILSRFLRSGRVVQKFGIQLKARAVQYVDAYRILIRVANLLSSVDRQVVMVGQNVYMIDTIQQTSGVISAGQDQRRRALATVNFMVMLIGA